MQIVRKPDGKQDMDKLKLSLQGYNCENGYIHVGNP